MQYAKDKTIEKISSEDVKQAVEGISAREGLDLLDEVRRECEDKNKNKNKNKIPARVQEFFRYNSTCSW